MNVAGEGEGGVAEEADVCMNGTGEGEGGAGMACYV